MLKKLFGSFWGNYSTEKLESAGAKLQSLAAENDPEGFKRAKLGEMKDALKDVTDQVIEARDKYKDEQKDVNDLQARIDQYKEAARDIGSQLQADPSNSELERSLNKVLDEIDSMNSRMVIEKEQAVSAKASLDLLESAANDLSQEIVGFEKAFEDAKADAARAEIEAQMAHRTQEAAERLAGIKKKAGSLNDAVATIKAAADAKRKEAESARTQADLLTKAAKGNAVDQDPVIAAALSKSTVTPKGNALDRLANL